MRSAVLIVGVVALAGCGGGGDSTTVTVNKTVTEPSKTAGPNLKTYRVPSRSMLPTFKQGTIVFADLDAYKLADPERGDLIVYHPPRGSDFAECGSPPRPGQACMKATREPSGVVFFKRIVGVPGDSLSIKRGRVYIGGKLNDPWPIKADPSCGICNLPVPGTIPAGSYYALGDNRGESADSRESGPIRREWIIGRVKTP